jgi:hypothetical protein
MQKSFVLTALTGIAWGVTPVAVFHGINDHCPQQYMVDLISEGIDYAAPVKCVEIGDGNISSIIELMEW